MTTRNKLQIAYELAFYPPRLDQVWQKIKNEDVEDVDEIIELLEMAMTMHRVLPQKGYSSMRALKRVAYYQACSRAFGTVRFLHNVYTHITGGVEPNLPDEIPGAWIRDFALPDFNHHTVQSGNPESRF